MQTYRTCFWSGILDLKLDAQFQVTECVKDSALFDVWLYNAQAMATIKTPLLAELARAPLVRFVMVVFHEDFHEQISRIPSMELNESATTLMGLLAARDFAEQYYGSDSDEFKVFAEDIEQHLNSALILTRYVREFGELYEQVGAGKVGKEQALIVKRELFAKLLADCAVVKTKSLASCSVVNNNARLAFQFAYAQYYPMFYRLHVACGGNTKKTGLRIIALAKEQLSEEEFVRRVELDITNRCAD